MGSVKPSVAEALDQAHAALAWYLRPLEEAASATAGDGIVELSSHLARTKTHLTEHFHFEEHNGHMDAIREREPRLEHAVQQLTGDHRQLLQSLDALLERTQAATSLGGPLREEVRRWINHVRQHEARENELVQEAFNRDIGAED
jgi:hypothetical protein